MHTSCGGGGDASSRYLIVLQAFDALCICVPRLHVSMHFEVGSSTLMAEEVYTF